MGSLNLVSLAGYYNGTRKSLLIASFIKVTDSKIALEAVARQGYVLHMTTLTQVG